MFAHFATTKLINLRYKSVEEFAVVTYYNCSTIEGFNGLFQHILRWHIKMVGRLVKNQQVNRFQQQSYHCQSATLTTTKHLNLLIAFLAAKHKCAKNIVYFQSYLALSHIVYRLVYGKILIQKLSLILSKVAYLYVVTYLQLACIWNLAHDTLNQCRLSFSILTHKSHLLATLYCKRNMIEHRVGTVVLANLITDNRIIAATQARWKLQMHGRIIYIINLDRHYLFQLFYLLLNLYGLGSLIAETFDKCLHISHFLLLVLVSP